jgi:hypothetical protein
VIPSLLVLVLVGGLVASKERSRYKARERRLGGSLFDDGKLCSSEWSADRVKGWLDARRESKS